MAMTAVKDPSDIDSIPLRRYADAASTAYQSRISWGGIFAGATFGIVFQVWLAMLGVAIGASTIDPLQEANPLRGLMVGSGIWAGLTILIAAFVGGLLTGRMSGWRTRGDSAMHGAVSWAVSNFVNLIVVGAVLGGLAGGATRLASSAVEGAGEVTAAYPDTVPTFGDRAQGIIDQAQTAVQTGEVQQQARQTGDTAAKAVAGTSFAVVALMFLGLLAGIGGAIVGAPRARRI